MTHLGGFGGFDMAEEETKFIDVTHGTGRGMRLSVPAAEAAQAVAQGWATNPFELPDPDAVPEPEEDEVRAQRIENADAAMQRWRGEEEAEPKDKAKTRDMHAGQSGATYQTRSAETETEEHRRGPGRPRKTEE
jgi:hypothetical protein